MGTSSKKSSQKTVYGSTKTTNPYVISKTNNKGTKSSFVEGSGFDTINNFVNSNIGDVLYDYLNPSLNSTTNQALLNSYIDNLNSGAAQTFENSIINPLSNRRMLRSSSLQNMTNNLMNSLNSNLSGYITDLLANSQQTSSNILNDLLNAYVQGFNVLNANQAQSLKTSQGNASVSTKTTNSASGLDYVNTAANFLEKIHPYTVKSDRNTKNGNRL